jgi:hypothetical protein
MLKSVDASDAISSLLSYKRTTLGTIEISDAPDWCLAFVPHPSSQMWGLGMLDGADRPPLT